MIGTAPKCLHTSSCEFPSMPSFAKPTNGWLVSFGILQLRRFVGRGKTRKNKVPSLVPLSRDDGVAAGVAVGCSTTERPTS